MRNANWWTQHGGFYCGDCNGRYFRSWDDLLKHLESSNQHDYCRECDLDFDSWSALRSHWANSGSHHFCTLCDTHCGGEYDLERHKIDFHWECRICTRIFAEEVGRYEHERQAHPFCAVHRMPFRSQANLQAHLRSKEHVAAQVERRAGCGRRFVDVAAMVLHLEAGTCSSGMTRQKIDRYVRQVDRSNIITNPRRLIAGPDPVYDAPTLLSATERSWYVYAQQYECPLCHRGFNTLHALNQHLASPRHATATEMGGNGEKLYRCPKATCAKKIVALSALVQHMETGSCQVFQLTGVQDGFNSIMRGMRSITL
ncbi:hypothetical protein JCM10449v2_000949 [Rhodotorula kratochvilovae]